MFHSVGAVIRANRLTEAVADEAESSSSLSYQSKKDFSPVTIGDYGAQALIISELRSQFRSAHFIAEETSKALREEPSLWEKVTQLVNQFKSEENVGVQAGSLSKEEIAEAVDTGSSEGGLGTKCFVLDPIDGTKGFVSGRQYCIALALVDDGVVKAGVLGCPRLPIEKPGEFGKSAGNRGCLFYAAENCGAWTVGIDAAVNGEQGSRVHVSTETDARYSVFAESVEKGHSSHELSARIANILNVSSPPVRMDSQAKYGCIARADFSIFMRFPRKGYVENIWDHAAGAIVIEEAGGRVSDGTGRSLNFATGRKLDNVDGIIATNGAVHNAVVAAVQQALKESTAS